MAQKKEDNKRMGYIHLHRSIREHWIWKDPQKFQWWVDILMECNHSTVKINLGYILVICERGQSLNSLLTWSRMWRVETSTVRRFLKLLENDSMIVIENLVKTTRITVCNYDSYNSYSNAKEFEKKGNVIPIEFESNTNNNDINNDKEYTGVSTPAYTEEEKNRFLGFQEWIVKKTPLVAKMREPFTIDQYFSVCEKLPAKLVAELLEQMHNWKPLLQKNTSAYLTLLNWSKKERGISVGNNTATSTVAAIQQSNAEKILSQTD